MFGIHYGNSVTVSISPSFVKFIETYRLLPDPPYKYKAACFLNQIQFEPSRITMSTFLLLLLIPLVSCQSTYSRLPASPYSFRSKPLIRTKVDSRSGTASLTQKYRAALLKNYKPSVRDAGPNDIVKQTRTQAEALKEDLRSIASNPTATQILSKIFDDRNNVCINSMDDAIDTIEASTKLIENAGTEITKLVESVKVFENLTDTPTVVRETAKIIRLLDVLIPKMTPDSSSRCEPKSSNVFGSMQSLASLVNELSSKNDIYFSIQKRQSLKSSAKIVTKVTNFLSKLKNSFSKFNQVCTRDKQYTIEVITFMSDMISDLADLYTSLGGHTAAYELSKNGDFTKKIVVSNFFLKIPFLQALFGN